MADSEQAAAAPIAPVSFKKRGARPTKVIRKRQQTPSDSDSDASSSEDETRRVKRRQQHAPGVTSTSTSTSATTKSDELFAAVSTADRSKDLTSSNDATKTSNWSEGPQKKIGPTKVSTNVRMTTVTDYAPDVCKDYKTTGFCGFGDNCKFLHDRSDYKQGWQLDKEWENVAKGRKNLGGTVMASANRDVAEDAEEDEEDAMLENIPFACFICKGPYKAPVVTRCGHYFCEGCALKRYRKDPSCAACGVGTNGVFNTAGRLSKLLEKKRERAAKRGAAAIEAGEEVSEEEEE